MLLWRFRASGGAAFATALFKSEEQLFDIDGALRNIRVVVVPVLRVVPPKSAFDVDCVPSCNDQSLLFCLKDSTA